MRNSGKACFNMVMPSCRHGKADYIRALFSEHLCWSLISMLLPCFFVVLICILVELLIVNIGYFTNVITYYDVFLLLYFIENNNKMRK